MHIRISLDNFQTNNFHFWIKKQKKWISLLNSADSNKSSNQISAETTNFMFWTKFNPKRFFSQKTKKVIIFNYY